MYAHPHRREELRWCFGTVLGGLERSLDLPDVSEPLLAFRFSGGGALSIEFTTDALDEKQARRGAWLELQTDNPPALKKRIIEAGLSEVKHPAHDFYFLAPGGQVFSLVTS
jgi:hypothetical protein